LSILGEKRFLTNVKEIDKFKNKIYNPIWSIIANVELKAVYHSPRYISFNKDSGNFDFFSTC
jgi:hypothetical protein